MNIRFLSVLTAIAIGLPMLASAAATGTAQQAQTQGAQSQAIQQNKSASIFGLCPKPKGILKRGSKGTDVTRLQQFLAQDRNIYPEGTVSGTYGALTEKAVQRFQVKNGIASSGTPDTTGYGAVGPRTAAAMAVGCAGASAGSGAGAGNLTNALGGFIATAPYARGNSRAISVQVTVNAANSCSAATYTLDYGDRTGARQIPVPAGACKALVSTVTHTYQLPGTYQVTLSSGPHKTSVAVAVQ